MGERVKKVCSRGRVLPFSMSCFLRWFRPKKYNSKNIEEWKNYLKNVLEVLKLSWKRGFRVLLSAMKCNSNDIFIGHRVLVMVMIHWFYRTLVLWQTRRFWLNSCGTQFLDLGFWVHFKIEKNQKQDKVNYAVSEKENGVKVILCQRGWWAVLACTGLQWTPLDQIGLYWAVRESTGLYRALLGCAGL